MKRSLTLTRSSALAIGRGAACVPSGKRRAFLKGVLSSLSGYRRPEPDLVAQAIWTGWLNVGLIPRRRRNGMSPFAHRKAA